MAKRYIKGLLSALICLGLGLHISRKTFSFVKQDTLPVQLNKKAIIFDLGGVLIKTNMKQAFDLLGKKQVIAYSVFDWKHPEKIRPTLYDLLHKSSDQSNSLIKDSYGDPLPHLFCQVLKGHKTDADVLHCITQEISNNKDHFCSKREQELCHKAATLMFDHQVMVSLQEEITEGTKLLQDCLDKGHHVIIFSNYSKAAFDHLKKKLPHVFSKIPDENIIISAHIGAAKPEPDAFHALKKHLTKLNVPIHPEHCYFLDDQHENIQEALNHDITGIQVNNKNYKAVRKQLAHLL